MEWVLFGFLIYLVACVLAKHADRVITRLAQEEKEELERLARLRALYPTSKGAKGDQEDSTKKELS